MTPLGIIIAAIALLGVVWAAKIAWLVWPQIGHTVDAARRRTRRVLVTFDRPRLPDSRLRKINQVQS